MEKIESPWIEEQVQALNAFQNLNSFHPFTCGGDRGDEAHKKYAKEHNQSDWGILEATENGWVCPVCGYTQNWAHGVMVNIGKKVSELNGNN